MKPNTNMQEIKIETASIGGGMAGLAFARHLHDASIPLHFDFKHIRLTPFEVRVSFSESHHNQKILMLRSLNMNLGVKCIDVLFLFGLFDKPNVSRTHRQVAKLVAKCRADLYELLRKYDLNPAELRDSRSQ